MEVSGQIQAPVALPPKKESLVLIGQKAGKAPEVSCTPSPNLSGIETPVVQPAA
jgi:hypothetical protein